jgi:hypothetical protein
MRAPSSGASAATIARGVDDETFKVDDDGGVVI